MDALTTRLPGPLSPLLHSPSLRAFFTCLSWGVVWARLLYRVCFHCTVGPLKQGPSLAGVGMDHVTGQSCTGLERSITYHHLSMSTLPPTPKKAVPSGLCAVVASATVTVPRGLFSLSVSLSRGQGWLLGQNRVEMNPVTVRLHRAPQAILLSSPTTGWPWLACRVCRCRGPELMGPDLQRLGLRAPGCSHSRVQQLHGVSAQEYPGPRLHCRGHHVPGCSCSALRDTVSEGRSVKLPSALLSDT